MEPRGVEEISTCVFAWTLLWGSSSAFGKLVPRLPGSSSNFYSLPGTDDKKIAQTQSPQSFLSLYTCFFPPSAPSTSFTVAIQPSFFILSSPLCLFNASVFSSLLMSNVWFFGQLLFRLWSISFLIVYAQGESNYRYIIMQRCLKFLIFRLHVGRFFESLGVQ